jgi:hypothetical protein
MNSYYDAERPGVHNVHSGEITDGSRPDQTSHGANQRGRGGRFARQHVSTSERIKHRFGDAYEGLSHTPPAGVHADRMATGHLPLMQDITNHLASCAECAIRGAL